MMRRMSSLDEVVKKTKDTADDMSMVISSLQVEISDHIGYIEMTISEIGTDNWEKCATEIKECVAEIRRLLWDENKDLT